MMAAAVRGHEGPLPRPSGGRDRACRPHSYRELSACCSEAQFRQLDRHKQCRIAPLGN